MMLATLALGGCTVDREATDTTTQAAALWQGRAEYVGNNSKVVALAASAGFGSMGTHTISLDTAAEPYGVTVAYSALDKPFEVVDFTPPATLLLATIANLDRVEVTSGAGRFELTSAEASAELGFDVKELGHDEAKLAAYLRSLAD